MTILLAMHETDSDHLAIVVAEMRTIGAPTIRAIRNGGILLAIEGTHRLAAANALGLIPKIDEIADADAGDDLASFVVDGLDINADIFEDGPAFDRGVTDCQTLLDWLLADGGPTGRSYDVES